MSSKETRFSYVYKSLKCRITERLLSVSYTHLRAHETGRNLVCRLLLEKKKNELINTGRPF